MAIEIINACESRLSNIQGYQIIAEQLARLPKYGGANKEQQAVGGLKIKSSNRHVTVNNPLNYANFLPQVYIDIREESIADCIKQNDTKKVMSQVTDGGGKRKGNQFIIPDLANKKVRIDMGDFENIQESDISIVLDFLASVSMNMHSTQDRVGHMTEPMILRLNYFYAYILNYIETFMPIIPIIVKKILESKNHTQSTLLLRRSPYPSLFDICTARDAVFTSNTIKYIIKQTIHAITPLLHDVIKDVRTIINVSINSRPHSTNHQIIRPQEYLQILNFLPILPVSLFSIIHNPPNDLDDKLLSDIASAIAQSVNAVIHYTPNP